MIKKKKSTGKLKLRVRMLEILMFFNNFLISFFLVLGLLLVSSCCIADVKLRLSQYEIPV